MKKTIIVLLLAFCFSLNINAQIARETRGVWVTTNIRLDWPPRTYNSETQKQALVDIFNDIRSKKLNTIYFQVRSSGTVLFKSTYDPFSPYITGEMGGEFSYDPLAFALYQAHRRGIELHAWINMIRCFSGEDTNIFNNPYHISKRKPEWVVEYKENGKSSYWLDPGLPEVRDYLVDMVLEIVRNYNIDGIHLDFFRYPGKDFNDDFSYRIYGDVMSRDNWRRYNLTLLIEDLSTRLKAIKPYVKLGVTPIGIYENRNGAVGLEGFHAVYQDTREWLRKGIIDYAVPQIYWSFNGNPKFDVLAKDWNDNSFGRNIVLGIAAYKPEVLGQVERMIDYSRQIGAQGIAFFRYGNIKEYDFKSFPFRTYPSEMAWIDNVKPGSPIDLTYNLLDENPLKLSLNWNVPQHSQEENMISYYSLYSLPQESSSFEPEDLFEIIEAGSKKITLAIPKPSRVEYHFAVKSVDKMWNESKQASNIVNITIPELEALLNKYNFLSRPVLIKRSNGIVKVLIYANKDDEVEISASSEMITDVLFKKKLYFGNNILSIDSGISGYDALIIKYKSTGRQVKLDL